MVDRQSPEPVELSVDAATVLGVATKDAAELAQPMVFFRVGWDFSWLSFGAVASRLGLASDQISISDDRREQVTPPELEEYFAALTALIAPSPPESGSADNESTTNSESTADSESTAGRGTSAVSGTVEDIARLRGLALEPSFAELVSNLAGSYPRDRPRDVVVLPGGWHRRDTAVAHRVALQLQAASVLAPAEGAWAWTVLWARPSLLVAAEDQLVALAKEMRDTSSFRKKRAFSKLRAVVVVEPREFDRETEHQTEVAEVLRELRKFCSVFLDI